MVIHPHNQLVPEIKRCFQLHKLHQLEVLMLFNILDSEIGEGEEDDFICPCNGVVFDISTGDRSDL